MGCGQESFIQKKEDVKTVLSGIYNPVLGPEPVLGQKKSPQQAAVGAGARARASRKRRGRRGGGCHDLEVWH